VIKKKNRKRSNHKKRNPLRSAWRRTQGKSNKPFTPLIEVQPDETETNQKGEPKNDETKQKETYA
jgi:hypothetical protein